MIIYTHFVASKWREIILIYNKYKKQLLKRRKQARRFKMADSFSFLITMILKKVVLIGPI